MLISPVKSITEYLQRNEACQAASIPESAIGYAFAQLAESLDSARPVLFIARDDTQMATLQTQLQVWLEGDVELLLLPAWDCLPYDRVSPSHHISSQRIATLFALTQTSVGKKRRIIIATANAVLQRVPAREILKEAGLWMACGEEINRDKLTAYLVNNGYCRVGKSMEPGEFSLRGSIIDIFPPGCERGVRIDLFGDTVETMHYYEPLSQKSAESLQSFSLLPMSEVLLNEPAVERFRTGYRHHFGAVLKDDPLYTAISEQRKYPGMEHWLPLFHERLNTLFDYMPNAIMLMDYLVEEAWHQRGETIQDYYQTRKNIASNRSLQETVYQPLPPELQYISKDEIAVYLRQHGHATLTPFMSDSAETVPFEYKPAPLLSKAGVVASSDEVETRFDRLKQFTRDQRKEKRSVVIACDTQGARERLQQMLLNHQFHVVNLESWSQVHQLSGKSVGLIVVPLQHGFIADSVAVISEIDLLGHRVIHSAKKKKAADTFLQEASSLSEGEYLVHVDHGIGRFDGLETLTVSGAPHDCLKLIYDGGDKLYLPVENGDVLTRYGGEDSEVRLDKLGSASWQTKKARLKEKIQLAAEELLRIAADRALAKAPVLEQASGLYEEFCARFPYAETEDQLNAVEEILQDLKAGQPMDRLICGDVGFGKTEVALRAAFVACMGGNQPEVGGAGAQSDANTNALKPQFQVAVITPTTLLCRQHFKQFKERFDGLGIEVRQLSRMVSAKEAKAVKEGIRDGSVHIVIGTHALLGKEIAFNKIGLMIVDEEQHFGVKQKEKLKQLKADVHVLTLSATPIPRTLQMSLSGVKELSLITTPPVDRLAVRTFVMPFDDVVIREALIREHLRGGQSFYVCPRISDIEDVHKKITALVPEVSVRIAHGQMSPTELDTIMNEFYDGKFDVLLSTTIIESGIDVPSANTMIIHRADMFGLSQLYQLRGRVGRGKTRAYAYLTLPNNRILSTNALKRLEVMQTLDTLGAGFTIASHDMDIRGYGNMIGEEQSGHIKEVGVELYQQMLQDAVAEAKIRAATRGGAPDDDAVTSGEHWSPQINLGIAVLLPETYVQDLSLRMGLYRRLSSLATMDEVEGFAAELVDRFGSLPPEVENLIHVMRIKLLCRKAGVERVDVGPKGAVLTFRHNQFANPSALIELITQQPDKIKLRADHKLVFMQSWDTPEKRLKGAESSLERMVKLVA